METTIEIQTKNPESRWVALDVVDGKTVVAEGVTPEVVRTDAEKSGKEFLLMFVPKEGDNYIL